MSRLQIAILFVAGAVGCHHAARRHEPLADACPPDPCPAPACPTPASRVEVQQPEETIVVKAPAPKIVVETPPPTRIAAPAAAAACAPFQPAGVSATQLAMPGFGGAAPIAAEVRDRTRLGFVLDTINIPIPWIRAIPVQRPTEVTFQVPPQQVNTGFAATAGFAGPVMTMPAMPMAMAAPGVQMAPVPVTGMAMAQGQMVVPNQGFVSQTQQGLAVGQGVNFQSGFVGQGAVTAGAAAAGTPGGAPAAAPGIAAGTGLSTQEQLNQTRRQLEELQRACEELRTLKESMGIQKK